MREQDRLPAVLDNTFLMTEFKLGGNASQNWASCQHRNPHSFGVCWVLATSPPTLSLCCWCLGPEHGCNGYPDYDSFCRIPSQAVSCRDLCWVWVCLPKHSRSLPASCSWKTEISLASTSPCLHSVIMSNIYWASSMHQGVFYELYVLVHLILPITLQDRC